MPRGAHRLSLLGRVAALLCERQIPFAVVGAAAMAVRGVSRSTRDVDLLVVDSECLSPATWESLRLEGIAVSIRRGDADDPLAGAVRLTGPGHAMLDIIVGRAAWQARVLERASPSKIEEVSVPVATAADLVLLKLYAGGPQDAWDDYSALTADEQSASTWFTATRGDVDDSRGGIRWIIPAKARYWEGRDHVDC